MKKILYSAAALALAFFAASCQQENLEPAVSANTVTYTVEVPGALATRALGDETTAVDKVYYQVYRATEVEDLSKGFVYEGNEPVTDGKASFELEFVKNQNFVVLFWAQNQNLTMFDIDDLRAVELTTPGTSNNVNAQVFAGSNVVTDCVPANGGKVTLSRPISQLNIATTAESLQFGTKAIGLETSTVTVKGLYPVYNVYTEAVSQNKTNFEYTEGQVPGTTIDVNAKTYTYVAMNYVGFAPKESTTVDVDFTITTSEGDVTHKVPNVPLKPNYRTNIIGNLLTEAADYDVTLDAAWADEEYTKVVVSTAADLQTTVNEAPVGETTEITLSGDINLGDLAALLSTKSTAASNYLTIPAGKSIVLNLNGYSVSAVDETSAAYAMIFNNGNLSIVNTAKDKVSKLIVKATVESGWSRRSAVVSSEPGSTLTVGAGVEIEHLGGTSMAYGIDILTNGSIGDVTVTIDGAIVKSAYRAIRQFLNSDSKMNSLTIKKDSKITSTKGNKSVWMQDASAKANKGSLVVEDGAKLMTDAYLDVTAGSTAWPVTVSIADSALQGEATVISENVPALYDVVLKDGIWTVETSFTFAEFVEAVIAAEGTYDGEGKTVKILPLSGKSDNTNGCLIPNRLQKYTNPDVYYAQYQRFAELQDVNISNVNFVFVPAAITVQDAWNTAGATTTVENVNGELQFMNSGSVTLTGCTFDKVAVSPINAPALTVAECQFSDLMAYAIKDIKAATVSITGTEFNNCNGGFWFANAPATVTVTNNTFTEVGRRGAIQFSSTGDYSNTTLNISGNTVDGIFLWQLNETITEAQLKPVLESNTYTTAYTENSVIPVDIAKIGDKYYKSLIAAVSAVEDGQTITLVADETFTEKNRTHNSGDYYDGLYYVGDKSFTIDLGGKTISQDGSVNDYLLNFKNNGTKTNTITLKNGTLDAGKKAYCALATSSSNAQKMTINLENINLINDNSSGAVIKFRGGAELNVKPGTVITGKNSYTGIEAVGNNTVVNIYDGAKIYQQGTSSYVGAIIGASYNATLNIYGGEGKSAKCGIIVMSTGATINVSGGEWIANGNGTVAGDNKAVLVSQNNRSESGWACKSILNVTGGTFKGGYNCYGMGPGVEADDAQINIQGGNFNANPSAYTSTGYQAIEVATGNWTVLEKLTENNGVYELKSKSDLFWFANEVNVNKNSFSGKTVKLAANIDLANAVWTPIGQTGATTFNGVFDGQNYTISNLNVDSSAQTGAHYSSGLFGWIETHSEGCGIVKNLKINGATVNGHHNCGALVGYITDKYAVVENCHVTGATITCTYANGDADGDKAGALIGNATVATIVKDCTATDSTVSGGRDSGQLIGAGKDVNVTGCSATNVTVSANGTGTGANVRNEVIGRLL